MTFKRFLLLAAIVAWFGKDGYSQGTACSRRDTFTSAANGTTLDNRVGTAASPISPGCVSWKLTYESTGFTALSIEVQGAPDAGGSAGTFVTVASGFITQGSNPSTTLQGIVSASVYYPFMRVKVNSVTGSGTIYYRLEGVSAPVVAQRQSNSNIGVASFNARTGVVVPASGDYTAAQVTNAARTDAANNFGAFAETLGEISTPSAPAAGNIKVYAKADGQFCVKSNNATSETCINYDAAPTITLTQGTGSQWLYTTNGQDLWMENADGVFSVSLEDNSFIFRPQNFDAGHMSMTTNTPGGGASPSQAIIDIFARVDSSSKYFNAVTRFDATNASATPNNKAIFELASEGKYLNNGTVSEYRLYAYDYINSRTVWYIDHNAPIQLKTGTAIDLAPQRHIAPVLGSGSLSVSSCGTGATVAGSDLAGIITEGTVATGCTLTFASAYTNAPKCVVSSRAGLGFTYTTTTTTLVITNVGSLSSTVLDYVCMGQ